MNPFALQSRRMKSSHPFPTMAAIAIFVCCDLFSAACPGLAAEEIAVRYGLFEQSVSIADLRHYVETQQASVALHDFLRYLSPAEQKALQSLLQEKHSVDLVALDRVLNAKVGETFLAQVAQAIERRDQAGVQALRSALILGIKPSEGLSILSVLQAYPSQRLTLNLPQGLRVIQQSSPHPPTDILTSLPAWQTSVEYQSTVSQNRRYQGCLFGDSISSAVGNTLGEQRFNFALGGMSTVSLIEQLKRLVSHRVKCQKIIIAIGTNDAWYTINNEQFTQNLRQIFSLSRALEATHIVLLPAFYSTLAASKNPNLAGPLPRVELINKLIEQTAKAENILVNAAAIKPLFQGQTLRENLTVDGVHLNATGIEMYRQALLKILNADSAPEL